MNKTKRWAIMNKVFLVVLLMIVLFAWSDSQNLIGMKQIDSQWQEAGGWDENANVWIIFWDVISPSWYYMWIGVLAGIGLIWYFVSNDKSEAIGIFVSGYILIWSGFQDLIYYVFSPDTLSGTIGCWAQKVGGVNIVSKILGETCPSVTSFYLSGLLGVLLAYGAYNYLQKKL